MSAKQNVVKIGCFDEPNFLHILKENQYENDYGTNWPI